MTMKLDKLMEEMELVKAQHEFRKVYCDFGNIAINSLVKLITDPKDFQNFRKGLLSEFNDISLFCFSTESKIHELRHSRVHREVFENLDKLGTMKVIDFVLLEEFCNARNAVFHNGFAKLGDKDEQIKMLEDHKTDLVKYLLVDECDIYVAAITSAIEVILNSLKCLDLTLK